MIEIYERAGETSTPDGLAVFCAFHPGDEAPYFQDFAESYLALHPDHRIYYIRSAGQEPGDEGLFSCLSQVQTIYLLVTSALLKAPSLTMEVIFPYAHARHLSLEPILMEEGLEELYGDHFGDLPFKRAKEGGSSLPKGLKKQIQDAFNQYVTLKYHLVNPAFCAELVALLLREQHLSSSQELSFPFLMSCQTLQEAITAYLLRQGVYAQDGALERPMDPGLMGFEDALPSPRTLQEIALEEGSPLHNLLLGLAYFHGIDLERDVCHGIDLVRREAQEGFMAALRILPLLEEERDGEGEKLTNPAWRCEAILPSYKAPIKGTPLERTYLFAALERTGMEFMKANDNAKARHYFQELKCLCDAAGSDSLTFKRYLLSCVRNLGQMDLAEGKLDSASTHFTWSLSLAKEILSNGTNQEILHHLSKTLEGLGDISYEKGKAEEAWRYYDSALEYEQKLDPSPAQSLLRQGELLQRVSTITMEKGYPEKAAEFLGRSLECYQTLVDMEDKDTYWWLLFRAYGNCGELAFQSGRVEEAHLYYSKGLEILQAFAEGTRDPRLWTMYASYLSLMGNMELGLGTVPRAIRNLTLAADAYQFLWKQLGEKKARSQLGGLLLTLGDLEARRGKSDKAKELYQRGIEALEGLFAEQPDLPTKRILVQGYQKLCHCQQLANQYGQSIETLHKSLAIQEKTLRGEENSSFSKQRIYCQEALSNAYFVLGRYGEAEAAQLNLVALEEESLRENDSDETRRNLCKSLKDLGDFYQALSRLEDAENAFLKLLPHYQILTRRSETYAEYHNQCATYEKLGELAKALKNYPAARGYYKTGCALNLELLRRFDDQEALRHLSLCYDLLAEICVEQGDYEGGRGYYGLAIETAETYADRCKTIPSRQDIATAYNGLGDLEQRAGNREEAEEYYQKDLAITRLIAEDDPSPSNLEDLADSYRSLCEVAANPRPLLRKTRDILEELLMEKEEESYRRKLREVEALLHKA